MRRIRTFGLVLYLVAVVIVVGAFVGSQFGPYQERFIALITSGSGKLTLAICLGALVIRALVDAIRLAVSRPEPKTLHLGAASDIEVTSQALESLARTAASDRDIMVEDVAVRFSPKDAAAAEIRIDAIALVPGDLAGLAQRTQERVQVTLDEMLGVAGARVRVRFLPSKTVTVKKEVAGE